MDSLHKASGVALDEIDDVGRYAQALAATTDGLILPGWRVLDWTRGESVFCVVTPEGRVIGLTDEGLGTKNLAARLMRLKVTAKRMADRFPDPDIFWYNVGICAVAMIVNDMLTLGVLPVALAQHLSFAPPFLDERTSWQSFMRGWLEGCKLSSVVWGGGETAELKGLVVPGEVVIKGASFGTVLGGEPGMLDPWHIRDGDVELAVASSGIHANGLSTARAVAEMVGYDLQMENGKLFGEAILKSTLIYRQWIHDCIMAGLKLRYFTPITGHGWRKLLRPVVPLVHDIASAAIPAPFPEFDVIGENMSLTLSELYANFNMGLGGALIIDPDDALRAIEIGTALGLNVWELCRVRKPGDGISRVQMPSLGIDFSSNDLQVR